MDKIKAFIGSLAGKVTLALGVLAAIIYFWKKNKKGRR